MLYIFAGRPQNGLNAGGLQYAIEHIWQDDALEHSPHIQCRKEGIFVLGQQGDEQIRESEFLVSPACLRDGIDWHWFSEGWAFGNGVTIHKTIADYESRRVVHGTELTLEEYLEREEKTDLSSLRLVQLHVHTEGWQEYEARWMPHTCPQENHLIHLTWLVTKRKLRQDTYELLQNLIEEDGSLTKPDLFQPNHWSVISSYKGKPIVHSRGI